MSVYLIRASVLVHNRFDNEMYRRFNLTRVLIKNIEEARDCCDTKKNTLLLVW